jgi:hypothetical protein
MTIQRMTISQSDSEVDDPRAELAKDSSHFLGYHKLSNVVIKEATLARTLITLEIAPLNRVSVEQYKARKAKPGMWSDVKRGIGFVCALPVLITAFVSLVYLVSVAKPQDWWGILSVIGCVLAGITNVVTIIFACVNLLDSEHGGAHRATRSWRRVALNAYDGTVPEFVLSKAVQIKRDLPNATFEIDQLFEEEERRERRDSDPFLVATLGKESFYIDVWDEKEYESKL